MISGHAMPRKGRGKACHLGATQWIVKHPMDTVRALFTHRLRTAQCGRKSARIDIKWHDVSTHLLRTVHAMTSTPPALTRRDRANRAYFLPLLPRHIKRGPSNHTARTCSIARLTLARFCGTHWHDSSRASAQTSRKLACSVRKPVVTACHVGTRILKCSKFWSRQNFATGS